MENIRVAIILEMLGKPKEHLAEAMAKILSSLESEKGVKVAGKTVHEPVPVKESDSLFTTFAEVELEIDTLDNYLRIMFAYLPSHVEVIYPEKLSVSNTALNDLGNAVVQRMHNYDAIVKKVLADRDILVKKLQEVAPHLFRQQKPVQASEEKPDKKAKKEKKKSKKSR